MNKVVRKNRNWQSSLKKKLVSLKAQEVAVGFPANKGLGTPYYEGGASVLEVAICNNYGTPNIPARPFMDIASKDIQDWFKSVVSDDVKACNSGRLKANEMYNRWGSVAKGMIQAQIGITPPPNAPSTIRKKGSATPLIDTGHFRQSVLYAIRDRTR
jgi:hypothetical protein